MPDHALEARMLARALERAEAHFDEAEGLPASEAPTSFYAYHTTLRGVTVHPLREAFSYARLLMESGDPAHHARAARILRKALQAQDTNTENRTYGIWPYFWEEPLDKMSPPDWNWADFCGSELLFIVYRHPDRLPDDLKAPVREAVGHAARSIQRRNVRGGYTNICALGSFVTLAAAKWLGWEDLWDYALNRLKDFAAFTDVTGSFNEYNSPTYAFVTMRALANILTYVDDAEVQKIAGALHERVWLSLALHFHAPTRQLAGPHSRAYDTDLHSGRNGGARLSLQMGTDGAVTYFAPEDIPGSPPFPERMRCPENLLDHFRKLDAPRQSRECFIAGRKHDDGREEPVVQGTTYLHPAFALGTVNRSDFWHQRRPFVGYWGGPDGGRFLQLRGQKNKHDFTSAHGVTIQEGACALTAMNFLTGAGDRHPSLDMVKDGKFDAEDMRLRLMFAGAPDLANIRINGRTARVGDRFKLGDRVTIALDGVYLGICYPAGIYGGAKAYGEIASDEEGLWIDCVLYAGQEKTWAWETLGDAGAVAAVCLASASETARDDFDRAFGNQALDAHIADGRIKATWDTPSGTLSVTASARPGDRVTQASDFRTLVDGEEVPMTRITEDRILE